MNSADTLWLPPPQDGDVERAAGLFAERWAAAWFPAPGKVGAKPYAGRSNGEFRWAGCAGAAAGIPQAALAKLGLALIGGAADLDNPADHAVLIHVAEAALDDLGVRLAGLADEPAPASAVSPASGNLALRAVPGDDAWALILSLGPAAQVGLRRVAAGQTRWPQLARMADALAPEPVKIGCYLGTATISAGELADLGEGDLIAFGSRLDDELPITLAGIAAPSGTAKVVQDSGGVAVRIAQAIDFT